MINAILINAEAEENKSLKSQLTTYYPEIQLDGCIPLKEDMGIVFQKINPKLIFLDVQEIKHELLCKLHYLITEGTAYIIISTKKQLAYEAMRFSASGFILKPIQVTDFLPAVNSAIQKIKQTEANVRYREMIEQIYWKLSHNDSFGIPTMDGMEILEPAEIVRCEGLQRCTVIYTSSKKKLISSYNIGQFIRLLEPLGFFSTHKSHLINLKHIDHINKENCVVMSDGKYIPISRRRKSAFLEKLPRP